MPASEVHLAALGMALQQFRQGTRRRWACVLDAERWAELQARDAAGA